MDLSKLHPSNWFKHEESEKVLPVRRVRQTEDASPFEAVHTELDRIFDSFFRDAGPWMAAPGNLKAWPLKPSLDLKATDADYQVSIELPGVDEKDITIEIENSALIISGEKKSEAKSDEEERGYYRMERCYGSFRRMLALPEDTESDNISAKFKSGILVITIPRTAAKEKKKVLITS